MNQTVYIKSKDEYQNQLIEYYARGYSLDPKLSNSSKEDLTQQVFTRETKLFDSLSLSFAEAKTRIALLFRKKLEEDETLFFLANLANQGTRAKILKISPDVDTSSINIDPKNVLKNKDITRFIHNLYFLHSYLLNPKHPQIKFLSNGEKWEAKLSRISIRVVGDEPKISIELFGNHKSWQLQFQSPYIDISGNKHFCAGRLLKISTINNDVNTCYDRNKNKKDLKIELNKIRPILNDFITALNRYHEIPLTSLVDIQCKELK